MKKFKKINILALVLAIVLCGLLTPLSTTNVKAMMLNEFEVNPSGVLTKYNGIGPSVKIPNGVKEIGENAFMGNTTIQSVTFPKTVTVIRNGAFSTCTNLVSVKFNSGLKEIEENAFKGDTNLSSFTLPSTVEKVGNAAFCACPAINSAYIPSTLNDIGRYAFGFNFINLQYIPDIDFILICEKGGAGTDYAQKYGLNCIVQKNLDTAISKVKSVSSSKMKVEWKKNFLVDGYEIQYSTSKSFSKKSTSSLTINKSSKSNTTINKLKKGKTYYVRMRGYKNTTAGKVFSTWSKSKTIKM